MKYKYYIVRCKNCGKHSGTIVGKTLKDKTFKCIYCNTTMKIKKKGEFGLSGEVFGPFPSTQIPPMVIKLNEPKRS